MTVSSPQKSAKSFHLLFRPSWSSACWELTGPLYSAVVALHLLSREEWDQHRVALLRHLMALAHARATDGAAAMEHPAFTVYKPYLLFFGLVQAFYEYFFKVRVCVCLPCHPSNHFVKDVGYNSSSTSERQGASRAGTARLLVARGGVAVHS